MIDDSLSRQSAGKEPSKEACSGNLLANGLEISGFLSAMSTSGIAAAERPNTLSCDSGTFGSVLSLTPDLERVVRISVSMFLTALRVSLAAIPPWALFPNSALDSSWTWLKLS